MTSASQHAWRPSPTGLQPHEVSGRYFEDCHEAEPIRQNNLHGGVAAHALDPDSASRLWQISAELLARR